ncbi:MAG: hypothetical protein ACHP6I_02705 [Rickettsiales bacterium]
MSQSENAKELLDAIAKAQIQKGQSGGLEVAASKVAPLKPVKGDEVSH